MELKEWNSRTLLIVHNVKACSFTFDVNYSQRMRNFVAYIEDIMKMAVMLFHALS